MGRVWIKSQLLPTPLVIISQLSTLLFMMGKLKHFYLPNTPSLRYWDDLNSGINQLQPIAPHHCNMEEKDLDSPLNVGSLIP